MILVWRFLWDNIFFRIPFVNIYLFLFINIYLYKTKWCWRTDISKYQLRFSVSKSYANALIVTFKINKNDCNLFVMLKFSFPTGEGVKWTTKINHPHQENYWRYRQLAFYETLKWNAKNDDLLMVGTIVKLMTKATKALHKL